MEAFDLPKTYTSARIVFGLGKSTTKCRAIGGLCLTPLIFELSVSNAEGNEAYASETREHTLGGQINRVGIKAARVLGYGLPN